MAIYNREDPRTALPQLEKQLNERIDGLLDFFYPVGCYFETSDTGFNPNKSWGGKWELETEGKVHIGAGNNYVAGATGGSATVTLNASQIPSHAHKITGGFFWKTWGSADIVNQTIGATSTATSGSHFFNANNSSGNTGGGGAHNNMQPYIVVNRWHRIA